LLNSDDQYSFSLSTRASFSLIAELPFTGHRPLQKSAIYQGLDQVALEFRDLARYPWWEISGSQVDRI
jgi:hypothetical protein